MSRPNEYFTDPEDINAADDKGKNQGKREERHV